MTPFHGVLTTLIKPAQNKNGESHSLFLKITSKFGVWNVSLSDFEIKQPYGHCS